MADDSLLTMDVCKILDESAEEYACDVILERAIPDLRDGLKPVHRKIIWQTYLDNLSSTSRPSTLATVAGAAMKWHPHGDGSIENAATNLGRGWIMLMPLLDIVGNGGSIDGQPAAARYIKTRRTKAADLLIGGLNENAVAMKDNFDGTAKEPEVLPAAIPSAMILGTQGIAWGMSTNILPHNPLEMLRACLLFVDDNDDVTTGDIMQVMKGPDFPGGGTIYGYESTRSEIENGVGSFLVRGSVRKMVDDKTRPGQPILEVYEVPLRQSTDALTDQIADVLFDLKSHFHIESVDNMTKRSEPSIQITFTKKATDETLQQVEDLLFAKTNLQTRISSQNRMVHKGWARVFDLPTYIREFLAFRRQTLVNILEYRHDRARDDIELIDAALLMIDRREEVTELAGNTESRAALVSALIDALDITERQADFISKQPMYRLSRRNKEWIDERLKKKSEAEELMAHVRETVDNADKLNDYLRDDLKASLTTLEKTKLFERRTRIVDEEPSSAGHVVIDETVTVEHKPVIVCARGDLTAIRIGERAFDNQHVSTKKQTIVDSRRMFTDDYVMFITKKGKVITRLVNDLPHVNLDDSVAPLNHDIPSLESDDELIAVVPMDSAIRILAVSSFGFVKLLDNDKIAPKTTTRTYVKKTGVASGLKVEGDVLHTVIPLDEVVYSKLQGGTLVASLVNDKGRETTKEIEFDKILSRHDSGTSSGSRMLGRLGEGKTLESIALVTNDGSTLNQS